MTMTETRKKRNEKKITSKFQIFVKSIWWCNLGTRLNREQNSGGFLNVFWPHAVDNPRLCWLISTTNNATTSRGHNWNKPYGVSDMGFQICCTQIHNISK